MLSNNQDPLFEEFSDYINSESVRDAFHILIGAAAVLPVFTCGPERKGAIRDFRFYTEQPEQPFAFIINRKSLLFYLRPPAIHTKKWQFAELQNLFSELNENSAGEWTIRINNRENALTLTEVILNTW